MGQIQQDRGKEEQEGRQIKSMNGGKRGEKESKKSRGQKAVVGTARKRMRVSERTGKKGQ